MRVLTRELNNRKLLLDKMLDYGFVKEKDIFLYEKVLSDGDFKVMIQYKDKELISRVIDLETQDDYVLVDVDSAIGSFAAKIKEEYEEVLTDMIFHCSEWEVFQSMQAKEVIQYIKDKYGDELEFLWEKNPDAAVVRHSDNRKWYIVFMKVSKRKLELDSDDVVEIIDLRCPKYRIDYVIDYVHVFPGYHMNKNSWITIPLDGTVNISDIIKYLDISYELK